ncbi:MAG TPA: VOC family protein [Limnochordia bacterium]|nr:VOC family protein [Limnochordia bacterium]
MSPPAAKHLPTSIAPWLSVANGAKAVDYYQAAFGAEVVYRLEDPEGAVVARLSIEGAEFWLSGGAGGPDGDTLGAAPEAGPIRLILTVSDPDAIQARAIAAGASEVFAVGEEHGWRLGRIVDPFGHHWEIGRPLEG